MRTLLVLGAGGHGLVVAEAAQKTGQWSKIAFLDDRYPDPPAIGPWPVVGPLAKLAELHNDTTDAIVALGNNQMRLRWFKTLLETGYVGTDVIHPAACISEYMESAGGSVFLAGSVVNAGVTIGAACIVNTAATIDHGSVLGDGVHVAPGANLAADIRVGEASWIGIGASVREQTRIADHCVIAAGAAVVKDVASRCTVGGVPARLLKI